MQPLVTVIIPTYNRESTIKRAIDSVLGQSYKNLEVIVVDDGSSDNTIQIVNSYQDKRLRLICLSENCGANIARNKGIACANGEYIAFQDSDDEWFKDKLKIQLNCMTKSNKKVCYCPYILIENNIKTIVPNCSDSKELCEEKIIDTLRKRNVIPTPALILHKEVIETVGMFDETIRRLQDYEYAIRICQKYEIAYVSKPLLNSYRMEQCITNNRSALVDSVKKIFIKHINFIDLDYMLSFYLSYCKIYDFQGIYTKELQEMYRALQKIKESEKVKECIETIEYMFRWYRFFDEKIFAKEFILYGAGIHGKIAYYTLKDAGAIPRCFWVTHKQQDSSVEGIPILEIPEYPNKQIPVIISVGKKLQEELIGNLVSRGLKDYFVYPSSKYNGIARAK